MAKPAVGFIGLGLMGRPMATNLVKAGFPVTVWNRTASRMQPLVELGARAAASPREAAASCDVLITIVSDPLALEAVLWGEQGALDGLRRGTVLVDSSTVSPMLARRVADACTDRAIAFLDAPVTGGTWGAEKGELTIMVGGLSETLAEVQPVFAPLAKRVIHIGPNGTGQTVKLAMNLLLALEVDALVEALALATAGGVPGERLVEVMQASMGRAPLLDVKAPLILEHKFPPSFPLRLMHKDLTLALDLAKQLGVSLPVGTAARETYAKVLRGAHEDLDYAAVALYYQKADGQSG